MSFFLHEGGFFLHQVESFFTHQGGNFYIKAALTKAALIKRLSTLQRSPHHSGTYT